MTPAAKWFKKLAAHVAQPAPNSLASRSGTGGS